MVVDTPKATPAIVAGEEYAQVAHPVSQLHLAFIVSLLSEKAEPRAGSVSPNSKSGMVAWTTVLDWNEHTEEEAAVKANSTLQ